MGYYGYMFEHSDFDEHECVHMATDASTGLRCIIAIHSSRLGPAAGGCRMWPYRSTAEALTDVLRLSRGMSYKNALANLPLGGGKSVILGDPARHKSPALFSAFGRIIDRLGGRYITAEDVGVTEADMQNIARSTTHVAGLPRTADHTNSTNENQAAGGDPSPKTARGILAGIRAALEERHGSAELAGRHIAVQGLGGVGGHLCHLLHAHGVRLTVADLRPDRCAAIAADTGAAVVSSDAILGIAADVLAPCALGGVLNPDSIPKLQCAIVAGGANNQLLRDSDGERLADHGVLYAPDYVINAGGIINVCGEHVGHWSEAEVNRRVDAIGDTLRQIFSQARASGEPTHRVADRMARIRIGLET